MNNNKKRVVASSEATFAWNRSLIKAGAGRSKRRHLLTKCVWLANKLVFVHNKRLWIPDSYCLISLGLASAIHAHEGSGEPYPERQNAARDPTSLLHLPVE